MDNRKIKIVLLVVLIILVTVPTLRVLFLHQIKNTISKAIIDGGRESECISQDDREKILDYIRTAYSFDENVTVESTECTFMYLHWIKRYVWAEVWLKTDQGEDMLYLKCYFTIRRGRIYITVPNMGGA